MRKLGMYLLNFPALMFVALNYTLLNLLRFYIIEPWRDSAATHTAFWNWKDWDALTRMWRNILK